MPLLVLGLVLFCGQLYAERGKAKAGAAKKGAPAATPSPSPSPTPAPTPLATPNPQGSPSPSATPAATPGNPAAVKPEEPVNKSSVPIPSVITSTAMRSAYECSQLECNEGESYYQLPARLLNGVLPETPLRFCAADATAAKAYVDGSFPGFELVTEAFFNANGNSVSFVRVPSCPGSMCPACPDSAVVALNWKCGSGEESERVGISLDCSRADGKYTPPPQIKCDEGSPVVDGQNLIQACTKNVNIDTFPGLTIEIAQADDQLLKTNAFKITCSEPERCGTYVQPNKWVSLKITGRAVWSGTEPGWCVDDLPLLSTAESCPCIEGYTETHKKAQPNHFAGKSCTFRAIAGHNYFCQTTDPKSDYRFIAGNSLAKACPQAKPRPIIASTPKADDSSVRTPASVPPTNSASKPATPAASPPAPGANTGKKN